MAVKTFNTRIKLKNDVATGSSGWLSSNGANLVLLQGEFAFDSTNKNFKIGDGTSAFSALPYIIGAAVMKDYTNNPTLPSGETLSDAITANDSLNIALAKLQSQVSAASAAGVQSITGDTWITPSASTGAVTLTHTAATDTANSGTATIGASTVPSPSTAATNTGKTATFDTVTYTFDNAGHVTGHTTTTNTIVFPSAADLGLSSAMHFIGVSSTDPKGASGATVSGHTTWEKGDVVLYGNKEYVLSGDSNTAANWTELGDEGSYAQKTITLTAGNGLTGGGTLEDNRTFAIDLDSTNANGLYLSGSTDGSKQLAMNKATDSQFGTVTATTGNGLTLTNGNLAYAHNTTAITVASKDTSTNIITINGTLTPDASDAITASNSISLAAVAATGAAAQVSYTNTNSGLTASNVQAAIDEVANTAAGAVQDVKTLKTSATAQSTVPSGESLEGSGDVVLHDIAKTGNTDDLIQGMTIVFDCGTATQTIDS